MRKKWKISELLSHFISHFNKIQKIIELRFGELAGQLVIFNLYPLSIYGRFGKGLNQKPYRPEIKRERYAVASDINVHSIWEIKMKRDRRTDLSF